MSDVPKILESSWLNVLPTMKSLTSLCLLLTMASCHGALVKAPSGGNFELLILHNNDMHARFEQTSRTSGACTVADREAGKCYGGFPRVAHVVKEARAAAQTGQGPPVLYLNAGDTYTGTAWFTIYKWKIAAEFINALQPDAVSLGNHEFDEGVEGLIPFIGNISTPVVAANLILDKVPALEQEHNLFKSIILVKDGVKIGIIGYLTAETKFLAPKNDVEYEDEVKSIMKEVQNLKNVGVNIFIALGHSGFMKDIEIARHVEDIDLVIGGHSNTFLSNSKSTDEPEIIEGAYPFEVTQKSGRIVRVVQAYAYTKYLGSLHLIFDNNGEIIHCEGAPMLLDETISKDPEVLRMVEKYRHEIGRINNVVVGNSSVTLHGDYCRLRECNIGNVLTDAMLNYTKENFGDRYRDVNIGIIQGGRIRTSIDRPQKPFEMTRGDWLTVIPFTDPLTIVSMNGSVLVRSLEHAIEGWRLIDSSGQFLQMSGMRVTYDLAKPAGSRVISAQAICTKCMELADIKENYEYKVLMSDFLAQGGDSFKMFEELPKEILSYNEVDSVINFLSRHGIVSQKETGRITLLNSDKVKNPQEEFLTRSMNSSSTLQTVNNSVLYVLVILVSIIFHIENSLLCSK